MQKGVENVKFSIFNKFSAKNCVKIPPRNWFFGKQIQFSRVPNNENERKKWIIPVGTQSPKSQFVFCLFHENSLGKTNPLPLPLRGANLLFTKNPCLLAMDFLDLRFWTEGIYFRNFLWFFLLVFSNPSSLHICAYFPGILWIIFRGIWMIFIDSQIFPRLSTIDWSIEAQENRIPENLFKFF